MNYYNEYDAKAAEWLRELIGGGLIPNGVVDVRSITEISSHDLKGFTQCHFFAGIGGWSRALQIARWPKNRPVWTGSCPCQPFSDAGQGLGDADPRHLWPFFANLIGQCRPSVVFGEQVASKAGRKWLSGVFADLEGMAYTRAGADLCAAGVGAPHIRQRLFWVAESQSIGQSRRNDRASYQIGRPGSRAYSERCRVIGALADSDGGDTGAEWQQRGRQHRQQSADSGACRVEHAALPQGSRLRPLGINLSGPTAWSNFATLRCADGKARRFEPGSFPLAYGLPGRVGLLRGYGNAIVPQIAAEFIRAYLQSSR
jgi:DNA (cytosine-5)-methyltransferase 1